MPDLFELVDASDRTGGGATAKIRMEEDAPVGPVMLASIEEMKDILSTQIRQRMPHDGEDVDHARLEKWKADGHRWRKEVGEFPIADILSRVLPIQFAFMCHCRLQADNEGSYLHTLNREQSNGKWMPSEFALRERTVPRNSATRDAKHKLTSAFSGGSTGEIEADTLDGAPYMEMVAKPVQMLEYVIIWTDAVNAPDANTKATVQITQTGDPGMAAAILASAEATQALAASLRGPAKPDADETTPEPKRK